VVYNDRANSALLKDNPATSSHTSYVLDGTKCISSHASPALAFFVPAVMSDGADNVPSHIDLETVIVLVVSLVFRVSLDIPSGEVMVRYVLVTSKVHPFATGHPSVVVDVLIFSMVIVFDAISLRYCGSVQYVYSV